MNTVKISQHLQQMITRVAETYRSGELLELDSAPGFFIADHTPKDMAMVEKVTVGDKELFLLQKK